MASAAVEPVADVTTPEISVEIVAPEAEEGAAAGAAVGAGKDGGETKEQQQAAAGQIENVVIGGEKCTTLNDEHFAAIRRRFGIQNDVLASDAAWAFTRLKKSGGKGGDMMGRSADKRFFVKEVSGSDHDTLLKLAAPYAEHVTNGDSYIARFYFHFQRQKTRKYYVVMNNWLPHPKPVISAPEDRGTAAVDDYAHCYDLKGTADDKTQRRGSITVPEVHKRCWSPMMCGCGITEARRAYYSGKKHAFTVPFPVTERIRETVMRIIRRDVEFFKLHGLMDYSLLVGIKQCTADEFAALTDGFTPGDSADQPYVCVKDGQHKVVAYYIGIIDFLQEWTAKKRCAQCIKTCACAPRPLATVPPRPYGDRFVAFFDKKFQVGKATSAEGLVGANSALSPQSAQKRAELQDVNIQ